MEPLFNINGLMFWTGKEIQLRRHFEQLFANEVVAVLRAENPAWQEYYVEAPLLTPRDLLNKNYTDVDIWTQELWTNTEYGYRQVETMLLADGTRAPHPERLALRPETTPGSYLYAQHLLNTHSGAKPPFIVWQSGKSFRREQDQVTKNMRLKEFYQQEFQCIYAADTLNDYQAAILEPMRKMFQDAIALPTRIVESDRLPSYSLKTMDVEVDNGDKWMEICSISKRTDFPQKWTFQHKGKTIEKDLLVLEVAIGLDRCVYNYGVRTGK
jgi:glycyl-tRNA synthetase